METTKSSQLQQVRFIFWMNLAMAIFSLSVFIKSFDSGKEWKIICAGVAFTLFLALVSFLFARMMKLRKDENSKA